MAKRKSVSSEFDPLLPMDEMENVSFTIVVPTKARWDAVHVKEMIPEDSYVLLCEPDEVERYREHNPNTEIVAHPKEVWPYQRKVQWALEKFDSVLFLDDDVFQCMHNEHGGKDPQCLLGPEDTLAWFQRTANDAKASGAFLWGFGDADVRNYDAQNPFRRAGWFCASSLGVIGGSKLNFHPDVWVAADYWISLLNAYEHRSAWMDTRICPSCKPTFKSEGGVSGTRTMELERADYELLKRYFGETITKKEATMRAKLTHEWQKKFVIPFSRS